MARIWKSLASVCDVFGFDACWVLGVLVVAVFVWHCWRAFHREEHLVDLRR